MNPFRELFANASATGRLQPRYYRLTTRVGFIGVAIGLGLLFVCFGFLCLSVGVPITRPSPFNSTALWLLIAFLAGIPIFIYIGCVLVAGLVGLILARRGKISSMEAWRYALLSKYPTSWFESRNR